MPALHEIDSVTPLSVGAALGVTVMLSVVCPTATGSWNGVVLPLPTQAGPT